jgi:hypothetical protein
MDVVFTVFYFLVLCEIVVISCVVALWLATNISMRIQLECHVVLFDFFTPKFDQTFY